MNYNLQYISPPLKQILESAIKQTHRFEKNLSYKEYDNAFVAPFIKWGMSIGCILGENGTVIHDSECYEWRERSDYYDTQNAAIEHKTVIYLGFLVTVFGHAFNDNLRKVWFLKTEECQRLLDQGVELVYTTSWNASLPSTEVEAFEFAGVDIKKARRIDRLTLFDKVIIPDNCVIASDYGRLFNQDYIKLIDLIKSRCQSSVGLNKVEKLYFTRTKLKRNRDFGEKRIERLFLRMGYTVISPEEYSLINQIQLVSQCSFFASTEGSVAHLTLFCRPGTKVIIINKANYLNYHQVMINEFADLDVTYIEAHHSIRADSQSPWWGPFFLYTTKYCKQFFKRHVFSLPYWLLPDYWFYYIYFSPFVERIKDWVRSRRKGILD